MTHFQYEHRDEDMAITAPGTSYALRIAENPSVKDQHVLFEVGERQYVTARSTQEILQSFPDLPLDPSLTYLEVGPGLGEVLPLIAGGSTGKAEEQVHIAIDPADYSLMELMLQHAYDISSEHALTRKYRDTIGALLERCQIMLHSPQIRLINTTLNDAMTNPVLAPQLRQSADVVIDHVGALYYIDADIQTFQKRMNEVLIMEESLVKPDGRYFAK